MNELKPEDLAKRGLLLLEALSGSRAYGLATPESDLDLRGVYMAPYEQLFGINRYQPQVQDEAHNLVYYELGRFLELLLKNNPSALELLGSPEDCLRFCHPLMRQLQAEAFLSKLCQDSFGQYALAQVRKARGLNKKIVNPMPVQRKSVTDFCFVTVAGQSRPLAAWLAETGIDQAYCGLVALDRMPNLYALYHDADGQAAGRPLKGYAGIVKASHDTQDVRLSSVPKGEPVMAYLSYNRDLYRKHCSEYKAYWDWVESRNQARYRSTLDHGGQYDSKNMMHTFRLLAMAEEIAREGRLHVRRPDRERLLEIRAGGLGYEALVAEAEARIEAIAGLYAASALPERPQSGPPEAWLIQARRDWYRDQL